MEREDQPPRKTRRHFPTAYKRQMVEETFEPNASVSIVARQHDVNANQLFKWRRLYRQGLLDAEAVSAALVPIQVTAPEASGISSAATTEPVAREAQTGELEITLRSGHRLVLRGPVDTAALRVALEVLG